MLLLAAYLIVYSCILYINKFFGDVTHISKNSVVQLKFFTDDLCLWIDCLTLPKVNNVDTSLQLLLNLLLYSNTFSKLKTFFKDILSCAFLI